MIVIFTHPVFEHIFCHVISLVMGSGDALTLSECHFFYIYFWKVKRASSAYNRIILQTKSYRRCNDALIKMIKCFSIHFKMIVYLKKKTYMHAEIKKFCLSVADNILSENCPECLLPLAVGK